MNGRPDPDKRAGRFPAGAFLLIFFWQNDRNPGKRFVFQIPSATNISHMLTIQPQLTSPYEPLARVTVSSSRPGHWRVFDGRGRLYFEAEMQGTVEVVLAGALGSHLFLLEGPGGAMLGSLAIPVAAETEIRDPAGRWQFFLKKLRLVMETCEAEESRQLIDGKFYKFYICWLRDHTHTLKGMKWFDDEVRTGFELYADHQRADGMIWDRVEERGPYPTWREYTFRKGGFTARDGGGRRVFERIPVENDVEYLFLECLHSTWQATGDTAWMSRYLDAAWRAVHYATTDRYRWSEKHRLLKRGYTIDTWDFLPHCDQLLGPGQDNVVDPEVHPMGIFHGDNTGLAHSLELLAEMLEAAGRGTEAVRARDLAAEFRQRLTELAWTGTHFRHHVGEDPEVRRDFGVDEEKLVSLSNAYALNRGIQPEQARAILQTYQGIRGQLPLGAPGEFYNCYPPFEKEFGNKWDYMNGGVSTICAGELARGALTHGDEAYGYDILDRIERLTSSMGEAYVDVCFKGRHDPRPPARQFQTIDLRPVANTDLHGQGAPGVPGWVGDPDNDMAPLPVGRQEFQGVPFEIIDPAQHGRRACLGLSWKDGYAREATVPVGHQAGCVHFLHALSSAQKPSGRFVVHYASGRTHIEYILPGEHAASWFLPGTVGEVPRISGHASPWRKGFPPFVVAWRGPNRKFDDVAVFNYGWDNPWPADPIEKIVFQASANGALWLVLGLTVGDVQAWFEPTPLSFGIPDGWGAAALVYALVEGLGGVRDTAAGLRRATVSPRWAAAGLDEIEMTAHYPACQGYVRYRYCHDRAARRLRLTLTTGADGLTLEVLLPEGKTVGEVRVNGQREESFEIVATGQSRYLRWPVDGVGVQEVEIFLKD